MLINIESLKLKFKINKIVVFITVSFVNFFFTYSQTTFQWAKKFNGNFACQIECIKTDASGNVYLTGAFEGTVDFDPSPAIKNKTAVGNQDAFIAKLNSSGTLLWVITYGDTDYDYARDILIDNTGKILVTGITFGGTIDFDPGPGTVILSYPSLTGFLVKLNPDGTLISADLKEYYGTQMCFDSNQNLIITGPYDLAKIDPSGNLLWKDTLYFWCGGRIRRMAVDHSDQIIIGGEFCGPVDSDPGIGTNYLYTGAFEDVFVIKLNSAGNFLWSGAFGGGKALNNFNNDNIKSILIDSLNNIYLGGQFADTTDFDIGNGTHTVVSSGYYDMYINKLDSAGNFVWVYTAGNTDFDGINDMFMDKQGNLYATGLFASVIDFDLGINTYTLNTTSSSDGDQFILKIDTARNFKWVVSFKANCYQYGSALHLDNQNSIFCGSSFFCSVDMDPGPGVSIVSVINTSVNAMDACLLKLNQDPNGFIENSLLNSNFNLYPNPANNQVFIDSKNYALQYKVLDTQGKLILESEIKGATNIDVSKLNSGIYFVQLNHKSGYSETKKLIITR